MGNSNNKISCEKCYRRYGELGVLRVYNNNNLGGPYFCVSCYPNIIHNTKYNNICSKNASCDCCGYNSSKSYISVFKVYWFGKYGGKFMCEKCLYNKKYRRENHLKKH